MKRGLSIIFMLIVLSGSVLAVEGLSVVDYSYSDYEVTLFLEVDSDLGITIHENLDFAEDIEFETVSGYEADAEEEIVVSQNCAQTGVFPITHECKFYFGDIGSYPDLESFGATGVIEVNQLRDSGQITENIEFSLVAEVKYQDSDGGEDIGFQGSINEIVTLDLEVDGVTSYDTKEVITQVAVDSCFTEKEIIEYSTSGVGYDIDKRDCGELGRSYECMELDGMAYCVQGKGRVSKFFTDLSKPSSATAKRFSAPGMETFSWPWVLIGIILIGIGIVAYTYLHKRK